MARPARKDFRTMGGEICEEKAWELITKLNELFKSSATSNSTTSTYSWFSRMVNLYCPVLIDRINANDDHLIYPTDDEKVYVKGNFRCALKSDPTLSLTEGTPLTEAQLFMSYRDLYYQGVNCTPIAIEGLLMNYGDDFVKRLTEFDYQSPLSTAR